MKFDEWFAKQHGPRPSSISTAGLIFKARELEDAAKNTRELITKCNEWEAVRSASRVAWLAAGGKE